MNLLAIGTALPDDPGRVVGLVTGDQVVAAPGWPWWSVVMVIVSIGAVGTLIGVALWRLRTSDFDAQERAFAVLARRQRLGSGARAMLRQAAEAKGCPPVALLVSRHALEDAIRGLGEARPSAAGAGEATDEVSVHGRIEG